MTRPGRKQQTEHLAAQGFTNELSRTPGKEKGGGFTTVAALDLNSFEN